MKNRLLKLIILTLTIFSLLSTNFVQAETEPPEAQLKFVVNYYDGFDLFATELVTPGTPAPNLQGPQKDGFIFLYWTEMRRDLPSDYTTLGDSVPEPYDFPDLEGSVDLFAVWKEDYNIWAAADDYSTIYVNGEEVTFTPAVTYQVSRMEWVDKVDDSNLVAAKAWDRTEDGTANIVGFRLALKESDGSYIKTDASWKYYYHPNNENDGVPPMRDGKYWYEPGYQALPGEWVGVHEIDIAQAIADGSNPNWADDGDFPVANKWIWSPNYDYTVEGTNMDSPIYLRSIEPAPLMHTIEVKVYNNEGGTASVTDEGTPAAGMILQVPHGNDLDFSAVADSNWTFDSWDSTLPETALEDGVYTVRFREDDKWNVQYLVYPGDESKGSVSPTSVEVFYGGQTAPGLASPASGYYFVGWFSEFYDYIEKSEEAAYDTNRPPMVWKEVLDVSSANAAYVVNGWLYPLDGSVDGMYTDPYQREGGVIQMYAKFAEDPTPPPPPVTNYDLTVNVVGDGSVPGFEGTNTFSSGTNVNLTAVEGADNFIGWTGDATATSLELLVIMSGDKTVTANFSSEPETFTLTVNVDGDGSVQPFEGTQTFAAGTVVDLTAVADEPADENTTILFLEWTGDEVGDLEALAVTMDADKTVTAVFDTEIFLIPEGGGGGTEIPDEELPQSGGLPVMAFGFIGTACIGLGAKLKKRK